MKSVFEFNEDKIDCKLYSLLLEWLISEAIFFSVMCVNFFSL